MPVHDTRLSKVDQEAWYDIAHAFSYACWEHDGGAWDRKEHATALWGAAGYVEGWLKGSDGAWDARVDADVAGMYFRVRPSQEGGLDTKYDDASVKVVRALKLAHAVATRGFDRIGRHDAQAVRGFLSGLPQFAAHAAALARDLDGVRPPRDQGHLVEVPFALAFSPPVLGPTSHVAASRARGVLPVVHVEVDDAPVAVVLATPGAPLGIRRIGGDFYRPVLAPNAWRTMGVGEFGEALEGRSAWRDNPTVPRSVNASTMFLAVGDMCAAIGHKSSRQVEAAARVAVEAAAARAGRIVVVDGVVHRRTETPRMALVAQLVDDEPQVRTAWTTGDLCSWDRQDVGMPIQGLATTWHVDEGLELPILPPDVHDEVVRGWRVAAKGRVLPAPDVVSPAIEMDGQVMGSSHDDNLEALGAAVARMDRGPRAGARQDALADTLAGILASGGGTADREAGSPITSFFGSLVSVLVAREPVELAELASFHP